MLKLRELLSLRKLDLDSRIKIVRHQNPNLKKLNQEQLHKYTSYQNRAVFDKCGYVISFIAWENTRARLNNVYRVKGRDMSESHPLPVSFPYQSFASEAKYFYKLDVDPRFDDLLGRVIIEWGTGALAWAQWLDETRDKKIVEILPEGHVLSFPGYPGLIVSFDQLCGIIRNRDAHQDWHRMLSNVAGIYLIVDSKTGKQYVGSAYGVKGLFGRWSSYANTGHGGNKHLKDLLGKDAQHARNFQFTILETLPRDSTKADVIARESIHKKKLGARAFGLNGN